MLTAYLSDIPQLVKDATVEMKVRREGFQGTYTPGATLTLIVVTLFAAISAAAAAWLSWTYNMYIGTPTALAFVYAILCFLFSDFYFMIYAFFLNPISSSGFVTPPAARNNKRGAKWNNNS